MRFFYLLAALIILQAQWLTVGSKETADCNSDGPFMVLNLSLVDLEVNSLSVAVIVFTIFQLLLLLLVFIILSLICVINQQFLAL